MPAAAKYRTTKFTYQYGSNPECYIRCPTYSFFRTHGDETQGQRKMGVQHKVNENGSPETNTQIINLSSCELNKEQFSVLKKGLKFTPMPSFKEFDWVKDINLFACKLALHKYHLSRNRDNPGQWL